MIERENLKFFKNIIDLQNKNINYRTLDDILYAIKEDDQFGFLHNILKATNDGIDYRLLDNVLQTIKKEPDIEYSLLDSFSTPQVNAKFNIINLNLVHPSSQGHHFNSKIVKVPNLISILYFSFLFPCLQLFIQSILFSFTSMILYCMALFY